MPETWTPDPDQGQQQETWTADPDPADRPEQATAAAYGVIHGVPGGAEVAPIGGVIGSYFDPNTWPFTGSLADRYSQAKATLEQRGQEAAADYPKTSAAASLATGVATIPGAPAEYAASQIPSSASFAPLLQKAAGPATQIGYGAGLGAVGALEGGGDPWHGALWGAGLSGAGEAAGYGINSLSRYAPITNAARDYEANRRISESLQHGYPAMTMADFNAATGRQQPVSMVDLGTEGTRDLARAVANRSPEAAATMKALTTDRYLTQATRFGDFVNGLYPGGQPLNTVVQQDAIRSNARAANDPAYQAAYRDPNAQAVWSPTLASLMTSPDVQNAVGVAQSKAANEAARQGVPVPQNPFIKDPTTGQWSLRQDPQGNAIGIPGLQFWDYVKRSLDDKVTSATRSGDLDQARDIGSLNTVLKNELDQRVPAYANARATAAKFFGQTNAVDAATQFNRATDEPTVNKMMQQISGMSSPDRETFSRAYAAQLTQNALNPSETRNVINMFNSEAKRAKLGMGLNTASNPDRASQVEAFLRTESAMNQIRASLGNSTTAHQQEMRGLAEPGGGAGHGGGGHGGAGWLGQMFGPAVSAGMSGAFAAREMGATGVTAGLAGFGAGAFTHMMKTAAAGINQDVVARVARKLASNNPDDINQAVNFTAKTPTLMQALRRVEGSLSFQTGQRMQ